MSIRRQTAVNPSAFNKIRAGLEDAHAYLAGGRNGFAVHKVKGPKPMARSFIVRKALGRS